MFARATAGLQSLDGSNVQKPLIAQITDFVLAESDSAFTKGPRIGHLGSAFNRIVTVANPCRAQILSKGLMHTAGFGSRVNSYLDELLLALYGGYSVALCEHAGNKLFVRNTWLQYFDVHRIQICNDTEACTSTDPTEPSMGPSLMGRKLQHCLSNRTAGHRDYLLALRYFITRQAFRLNPQTHMRIAEILADSGIDNGTDYVGIHIRHGDKWHEADLVPTRTYGEAVANISEVGVFGGEHPVSKPQNNVVDAVTGTMSSSDVVASPGGPTKDYADWAIAAVPATTPAEALSPPGDAASLRGFVVHDKPVVSLQQPQQEHRLDQTASGSEDIATVARNFKASQLMSAATRAIRDAVAQSGARKVYVASDDPRAFKALQGIFMSELEMVQQPPVSRRLLEDRTYGDDAATISLLTDIVALRRASVFIGTASSNIGELVYYLRRGKSCVSMDSEGDWMNEHKCTPIAVPV